MVKPKTSLEFHPFSRGLQCLITCDVCHGRFGSSHSGGMNPCLADGSVRFIRFAVSQSTFQNLGVRNDGNVVNMDDL